jgi:hypothetical protein
LRDSAEQAAFGAAVGGDEAGNGAMTFVIPSPGPRFTGEVDLVRLGQDPGGLWRTRPRRIDLSLSRARQPASGAPASYARRLAVMVEAVKLSRSSGSRTRIRATPGSLRWVRWRPVVTRQLEIADCVRVDGEVPEGCCATGSFSVGVTASQSWLRRESAAKM